MSINYPSTNRTNIVYGSSFIKCSCSLFYFIFQFSTSQCLFSLHVIKPSLSLSYLILYFLSLSLTHFFLALYLPYPCLSFFLPPSHHQILSLSLSFHSTFFSFSFTLATMALTGKTAKILTTGNLCGRQRMRADTCTHVNTHRETDMRAPIIYTIITHGHTHTRKHADVHT